MVVADACGLMASGPAISLIASPVIVTIAPTNPVRGAAYLSTCSIPRTAIRTPSALFRCPTIITGSERKPRARSRPRTSGHSIALFARVREWSCGDLRTPAWLETRF